MIVGTVVGVAQTSVKRMLAYSSIAHGGYLLVALVSANDIGKGAVLFYLLAYAVTNLGAFGVIALLENAERPNDRVQRLRRALDRRTRRWPLLMTIFLLSLGGFPPLGGFIAKWYVFSAAVKAGYYWLAIIGVLTSVVSVFFYLRIVVMMYMTPADNPAALPGRAADRRRGADRARRSSCSTSASCRRASSIWPAFDRDDLLNLGATSESRRSRTPLAVAVACSSRAPRAMPRRVSGGRHRAAWRRCRGQGPLVSAGISRGVLISAAPSADRARRGPVRCGR